MKRINAVIGGRNRRNLIIRGGVYPLLLSLMFVFLLSDISPGQEVWKNYTDNSFVRWLALEGNNLWQATYGGAVKRNITNPYRM